MFNKKSSRPSLALFVALALSSGALLVTSAASAADVNGQNVEIDDAHAPSNNAIDPGGGPAFGTAAGFIGNVSDSGNVTNNTLTFKGLPSPYDKSLFGGRTFGTGSVTGNRIIVKPATTPLLSSADGIFGGVANGGGSVQNNHAVFNGDHLNNDMVGGMTRTNGTGLVQGNTATLKGGSAHANIYGGMTKDGANGDVIGNTATIEGGTARTIYGGYSSGTGKAMNNTVTLTDGTLHGDIYGGVAASGDAIKNTVNINGGSAAGHDVYGGFSTSGNATGNIVNITGGSVRNVDGGRSASGDATGNTVNIGSEDAAFGGSIAGIINGGSGTTYGKDYRTGNKLNLYGNVSATNINHFAEINFHFNSHVNQSASFLTLTDGGGTTIESLSDIHVYGKHSTKGTLLQNTSASGSITITDGQNRRIKTSDDKELILEKSTDSKKITYEGYRFANATEPTTVTEGGFTSTWGGRSIVGNSTRKNEITVASGTHTNIYGGWTAGSGTTADDKDNSYKNEVTLDGSSTTTDNLYGGYVDTDAGKAEENTVTVKNGTVNTAVYGGVANKVAGTGHVKKNKVNISGGTVSNVYGGYSAGLGDVLENEVTATGGTLNGSIHGGQSTTGAATGNIVTLKNVTVSGNVTGGDGATTTGNTVNLNGGANVTGALKGGSQANGTGNTLNVKGANSAANITGFQKLHFDTDTATGTPMLTLSTAGAALTLASIEANGAATENPTTLVHNAAGLNVADAHQPKSTLNAEGTRETNLNVRKTGTLTTDIVRYAYTFKGARMPVSVTEGGVTNTWGGRSKAGNTTTDNKIAVASGTHTNVYGGWTAGSGTTAAADKQNDSSNNTVTVTGGTVANLYGGYTEAAAGHTTGNTVNIGDGEHALASGTSLGTLSGGNKDATANTLNVRANATASQIENFSNVTFEFNHVINRSGTLLNLTNTTGTTLASLSLLNVSGTPNGSGTLIQNSNGVTISDGVNTRTKTGDTTEATFQAHSDKVTYEGYTFKGVKGEHAETTDGANTYGGRSKLGNTTTENEIVVSAHNHTNIYGGWTNGAGSEAAADKQKDSIANKVTVKGSATATGNVIGGLTEAAGGKAAGNTVTVEKDLAANIIGGKATGEASGNTVNLANATVNSVTGGEGAATNDNTVNLNGGANVTGVLKGGSAANGTGNTLNVKGVNSASSVTGFQKMNFDATGAPADAAMLRTTGATDVNWETLTVKNASASEKPLTLLENANGINVSGRTGDAARSELNADATMETNIDVRQSGSKVTAITYEGYTFRGAAKATTYGADTWAGRSKAGNTTQDNTLTLDDASKSYTNVYGGWTSGTGTKAAADKQNNSLNNTVNYTAGTLTGTLYGGYAANGEASGNTVNLGAGTSAANIYGGFGTVTKNNTINLKGARITGTVYGGSDANGTGNTLAVYKPSEVHDFAGVQNLHFYTDEMAAGAATPMLKLGTATKDIRGLNIGIARSGAAPKLIKGDKILLMKTAGGALATDAAIQNKFEGMQGVSRRYEYEIKQEATGELTATVTKAGFAEQAKSLVETRAGLANFVNQGADYLVQDGLAAAEMSVSASDADKGGKHAQRQGASSYGAAYQLWAGAGANSMRAESGSYVDSKGWNLGVGWAREDVQKDGAKVLFSPFVEYGRGTYDSYLDDGTHGSGKVSYIGAGILGKLTQKDGLWLEGSLRAGRSKSDYSANLSGTAASYDGSNTYYGAHLGAGKTFAIKEDSSIDAYARYFWSHQNSMTATLNTGDLYEFGSVNSQRLRLGLRYSLKDKTTGEFYAGLAWEHEFAGKAGATYQGDAAPSPSLKGSSTMLELGYRFMPENSRVSYDLHLNGWQGKRKGITGGASVKWAF